MSEVIELQYRNGLPDFRLMVIDQTIKPTTYAVIYQRRGHNWLYMVERYPRSSQKNLISALEYFGISAVYLACADSKKSWNYELFSRRVYRDIKVTLMAMNPEGDFSALASNMISLRHAIESQPSENAGYLLNGLVEGFLLNQAG